MLSFMFAACRREKDNIVKIPEDGSFVNIPMGKSRVRMNYDAKTGGYIVFIIDEDNKNVVEYANTRPWPMFTRNLNGKEIFMADLNGDLLPDMARIDYKNGNLYKVRINYNFSQYGKDRSPLVPLDKAIEEYRLKEK